MSALVTQRTADRAARAAGTVYRVAAGTESLDIITENTHPTTKSTAKYAVAIGDGEVDYKTKQKKSITAAQQSQPKQQQRSIDGGDVDADNDIDATSRQLTTTNGLSQYGVIQLPLQFTIC